MQKLAFAGAINSEVMSSSNISWINTNILYTKAFQIRLGDWIDESHKITHPKLLCSKSPINIEIATHFGSSKQEVFGLLALIL